MTATPPAAETVWAVQFTGVGGEPVVHTRDLRGVPFADDAHAAAHATHLQCLGRRDARTVYQANGSTGWMDPTPQHPQGQPPDRAADVTEVASALHRHSGGRLAVTDAHSIAAVALRMAAAVTEARAPAARSQRSV